jgi:D-alanine-D-alanine ligase
MKKNIAIIAGGDSSEYEISIESAAQLIGILDKKKYEGHIVSIRNNVWEVQHPSLGNLVIDRNDFSFESSGVKVHFDCALISIHGTPGEDGKLQSYFDLLKIPYTTSGVLTSALTFSKYTCKAFLNNFGINTAKAILVRKGSDVKPDYISKELGLPCFVKPNNGGSSFGVTKVASADKIMDALDSAFKEDDEIIIEEFISGMEVTCGLLKTGEKEFILPLTEIVSKTEFFDYDAKYKGMADEITPARVSKEIEKLVKDTSSFIYDVLNCKGIVRIDYIFSNGKLYFLEVNTVPGMSKNSIVPQQARAAGLDLGELFSLVIEDVSGS